MRGGIGVWGVYGEVDTMLKRNPTRATRSGEIDFLFEGFDRSRYGCYMRRIEILLCRDETHKARLVYEQMIRDVGRPRVSVSSSCYDVLPYRLAQSLESLGCLTLEAAHRINREQLRQHPNIGPRSIALINETYESVRAGKGLPRPAESVLEPMELEERLAPDYPAPTPEELALPPEPSVSDAGGKSEVAKVETQTQYTVDKEYTVDASKGIEVPVVAAVDQAIKLLVAGGPGLVDAIDRELVRLEDRMDELRRVRRLLGKTPRKRRQRADDGESEHTVGFRAAVPGELTAADRTLLDRMVSQVGQAATPMTVAELSRAVECHHMTTRRIIAASKGQLIERRGKVVAV
jgi:hypothetical protein